MAVATLSRPTAVARAGLALLLAAIASLLVFAALAMLQEAAIGLLLFLGIIGLTVWRVRFGLYTALFLLVVFEPQPRDPVMYYGWIVQSDVSSWTPFRFINFTPIELLLLTCAAVVVAGCVVERRGLARAQLQRPLVLFGLLLAVSIGYGRLAGGSLNTALWETRALFSGVLIALLVPAALPRRRHVEHLVDLLVVAAVLLSIEIIWRRLVLLAGVPDTLLDLAFAHDTPTLMNTVVMLLLGRLMWPASTRQRLLALAIPLILYAEMLTNRRAGWIGLDLGLMLLVIFVFRLRRRLFWFAVVPALLVYGGYLLVAWNADGAWAQPARAVRSISSPDARDAASNLYRVMETANIRLNIHAHPVTGLGFGRRYVFYIPLPNLSWWPFWYYEAHNSILWLWMEMGPLGFMAFLGLLGAGIVRGVQLLKMATSYRSAPIVITLVSALLMVAVYCYVDLGLVSARIAALMGLSFGVIGFWGLHPRLLQDDSV